MEVRFCTDFDCVNGVVPGYSPVYASTDPNYGQPEDYQLLDTVYLINGNDKVLGIVVARHVAPDGKCYCVLNTGAHSNGIPDPLSVGLYLQTLSGLLGQGSYL